MLAANLRSYRWMRLALSGKIVCAAVVAGGLLLRLDGLGYRSIEQDEAGRIGVAQLPLSQVLSATIHTTTSPPLSDYLLNLWGHFAGFDEFHIRLWAALWGSAAILAAYLVSHELSPQLAWLPALLVAVLPLHVYYSRDVGGPYYIWAAASWFALWAYLRFLRTRQHRWMALYLVLAAIGLWLHFFMVLLVAAVFAHWLGQAWQERRSVSDLFSRFAVLHLVLVPSLLGVAAVGSHDELGTGFRLHEIGLLSALKALAALSIRVLLSWVWGAPSAAQLSRQFLAITSDRRVQALEIAVAIGCLVAALVWFRRGQRVRMLIFFALAPVVAGLVIMISRGAVLYERHYLPFALPAYVLLAIVIGGLPQKVRTLGLAVVLAGCAAALALDLRAADSLLGTRDWRGAAEYVGPQLTAADRVIFPVADEQLMFNYYLPSKQPLFLGLPSTFTWSQGYHLNVQPIEAERLEPLVSTLAGKQVKHVWLVTAREPRQTWSALVSALEAGGYGETGRMLFGGESDIEAVSFSLS